MTFPLLVFAIDREIFVGQAESLAVPGVDGDLEILAEHTPLISQLREGDVLIKGEDEKEIKLPIAGGVVEVKDREVVVLVNF
jgi:F-type H+-transporting ATPase subunit epsilon